MVNLSHFCVSFLKIHFSIGKYCKVFESNFFTDLHFYNVVYEGTITSSSRRW